MYAFDFLGKKRSGLNDELKRTTGDPQQLGAVQTKVHGFMRKKRIAGRRVPQETIGLEPSLQG